jgi:hypothetical protein
MDLYDLKECGENNEILLQDRIDLFEVQVPVYMDQDIAEPCQGREIADKRFEEVATLAGDLKSFPARVASGGALPRSGRSRYRSQTDADHHRMKNHIPCIPI